MLQTTVELAAPPQEVWDVLTAFSNYETWHPLLRLSGDGQNGQIDYSRRVSLTSHRWITTQIDVTEVSAPYRLAWRLGARAFFATDESFELEICGSGTILTHRVEYRGVLAFIVEPFAKERLRASVELFDGLLARQFSKKRAPAEPASRKVGGNRATRRRNKRR